MARGFHYHVIDSQYGDPLARRIPTYEEAQRLLLQERSNWDGPDDAVKGSARSGMYHIYSRTRDWKGRSNDVEIEAHTLLSILLCPDNDCYDSEE